MSNSGDVTDVSDNGNDGDGNTTNDATVVEITPNPSMEVKKGTVTDNGDGTLGVGDTVNYSITIENKGNVNLTSPVLVTPSLILQGKLITLTTSPTFSFADLGSTEGTIKPDETAHYAATYIITQDVVDAGVIAVLLSLPVAQVTGGVTDRSDDGDDTDGNTTDDNTNLLSIQINCRGDQNSIFNR